MRDIRVNPKIHPMPSLFSFHQSEWAPICKLDDSQRAAVEQHLLGLEADDRYLRFGHVASDDLVRGYVQRLDFDRDEVLGIFNRRLELIGMAHLARDGEPGESDSVEFGVSVSRHARGRGYGNLLFRRAMMHARNEGVSVMHIHALTENKIMLGIARNAGATVVRDGAESVAHLRLPPADFESQFTELVEAQQAQANYHLKAQHCQFKRFLQVVMAFPSGLRQQEKHEAESVC